MQEIERFSMSQFIRENKDCFEEQKENPREKLRKGREENKTISKTDK